MQGLHNLFPFLHLQGIDSKIDVDDEIRFILDNKLQKIKEKIHTRPLVTFTYFVPDLKKDGGKYITVSGNVKKIDEYNQIIILVDNTEIHILDIIEIAESQALCNFW